MEAIPTPDELKVIMEKNQCLTTEERQHAKFHAILLATMKGAHNFPIIIEIPGDCFDGATEFTGVTMKYLGGVYNYGTKFSVNQDGTKGYSIFIYYRVIANDDPVAMEALMKILPKEMVEGILLHWKKFPVKE